MSRREKILTQFFSQVWINLNKTINYKQYEIFHAASLYPAGGHGGLSSAAQAFVLALSASELAGATNRAQ